MHAVVADGVVVHGERTLTDLDYARLAKLMGQQHPPALDDLLTNANITSARAVHADVVTMNSRVELADVRTQQRQVFTLCYPRDAEPAAGRISVLSPVGIGLLGLRTGDVAKWQSPRGEEQAAVIENIQFQPEASGDYVT